MSADAVVGVLPASESAWRALVLAAEGAPCSGPHADRWTSDDPEDRAAAAFECEGCPVIGLCRTYADLAGERFHVWAGVDRTRGPGSKRRAA